MFLNQGKQIINPHFRGPFSRRLSCTNDKIEKDATQPIDIARSRLVNGNLDCLNLACYNVRVKS